MLTRWNHILKTGLLGFLSGAVAILLACAVASRLPIEPSPRQAALMSMRQLQDSVPAAEAIECVYTSHAAEPTEAVGGQAGAMILCSEQSEPSIYGTLPLEQQCDPSCMYRDSSCAEDVCLPEPLVERVPATASDTRREILHPKPTAAAGQPVATVNGDETCPATSADADADFECVDRVCSLQAAEGEEVVATVRMSGSVRSTPIDVATHCSPIASPSTSAEPMGSTVSSSEPMTVAYPAIEPSSEAPQTLATLAPTEANARSFQPTAVTIRFDRDTQMVIIEAVDVDLDQVLARVGREIGHAIGIRGDQAMASRLTCISEGPTLLEALRRMLHRQGFALVEEGAFYYVSLQSSVECIPAVEHHAVADVPCRIEWNRDAVSPHPLEDHAAEQIQRVTFAAEPPGNGPETEAGLEATRLPEPWEIVESAIESEPQAPAVPPGIGSMSVEASELRVAKEARQLIAVGALGQTIDLLTQAVAEHPQSALLFRMLGEAYMWRDDYEAASHALEYSISLNKMDPISNNLFAEALLRTGQSSRASHYQQQAFEARRVIESGGLR